MPDPRPLSSLRTGAFDDPPASSESSTPESRRIRRAIQDATETSREELNRPRERMATSNTERRRLGYIGPMTRRRRRSDSTHDDEPRSEVSGVDESRRRRHKRRRIDQAPPPQPRQRIKYGYYGQVEPGRLKLELVSCDGGEHTDPRYPHTYLGAENLLRNDESVYCSERPNSTILFRHMDDTPFCLEKLHIVGPENGFTAPVRSGLVYVAMTMNDLQKYIYPSSHGHLRESTNAPASRRRWQSLRSSPERLSLADALRDPEVTAAFDERERDRSRVADMVRDLTGSNHYGTDFGSGRTDPEAHCEIPPPTDLPPDADDADERPVTLHFDEDPGPEDASTHEVMDYRLQRLLLMRRRPDPESIDARVPPPEISERERETGMWNVGRLDALMARSRVHDSETPEGEEEVEGEGETAAFDEGPAAEPTDKNVTAAKFGIKRGKHKVAIKFDPPVSGRFVLVKVAAGKSNVDVQSVVAKGYGGCRFFPSMSVK